MLSMKGTANGCSGVHEQNGCAKVRERGKLRTIDAEGNVEQIYDRLRQAL